MGTIPQLEAFLLFFIKWNGNDACVGIINAKLHQTTVLYYIKNCHEGILDLPVRYFAYSKVLRFNLTRVVLFGSGLVLDS